MSWLRNHKHTVYRAAVGAAAISLICFIWAGVNLYRNRKLLEAEIAARDYVGRGGSQGNSQGSSQGGSRGNSQGSSQGDSQGSSRDCGQWDTYLFGGDVVEYNGKRYRRSSYVKAILCIGVDRSGEMTEKTTTGFGGQADGVFLIAQDTARNTIKILMIPRDTMTDITLTDLSGNELGKDMQHLTLAYAYGDGREKSCQYMVDAVSELLGGLKIEWYMAADTSVIPVLNDEVGGVTVTIETDGMENRDPALVKGETVTLKGKQAEVFVRYRDVNVDHSALYRMDQQQQYIKGFFQAVQRHSAKDSGLVVRLFERIQDYMVTNMTKDQYLKVAMDAVAGGKLGDEDFYTVPGEGVVTLRFDEFYADREALIPILLELFYREIE